MNKIFSIMFGSNLYGTSTPDSDKDYKHIHLPDLNDLLLGKRIKNKVETTGNEKSKNGKGDVDKEYVPLQVFLNDFFSGQSYALEVAFGAVNSDPYAQYTYASSDDGYFLSVCEDLTEHFVHRNVDAMVGFAVAQAVKYGMKGNRLRALEELVEGLSKLEPEMILGDVDNLTDIIDGKRIFITEYQINEDEVYAPCINVLGKIYPFTIKVQTAQRRAQKAIDSYGARAKAAIDNGIDWKSLHHALRVSYQCIELLDKGTITLPLTGDVLNHVMDVKLEKRDYVDVIADIKTNLDIIDELKKTTKLIEQDDLREDFNKYKLDVVKLYYGLDGKI